MTASPLERAARALCSLDGHPEDAKMDGKPLWMNYLPEVRAVLAAIREPSQPMLDAAFAVEDDVQTATGWTRGKVDCLHRWPTMIDAMLEEGA